MNEILSSRNNNNNLSKNSLSKKNLKSLFALKDIKTIFIVDDESLTRQSTIRILQTIALENEIKINIEEAEDGLECLYLIYKYLTQGNEIFAIICDQTMNYLDGSNTSEILKKILEMRNIPQIPFFILTAYEDNYTLNILKGNGFIKEVFSKPLSKKNAFRVLEK